MSIVVICSQNRYNFNKALIKNILLVSANAVRGAREISDQNVYEYFAGRNFTNNNGMRRPNKQEKIPHINLG